MLDESRAILIDHELGFEQIDETTIALAQSGQIDPKFVDHHIFLPLLKKAKNATKSHYFEEFAFYLENLKLGHLNAYFRQLERFGYSTNEDRTLAYLNAMRHNSVSFINALRAATKE